MKVYHESLILLLLRFFSNRLPQEFKRQIIARLLLSLRVVLNRHNERDGVSNHRRLDCLSNRLFRCRSKTSRLGVTDWPFDRVIHRSPVDSLQKGQVTGKLFQFDDVNMCSSSLKSSRRSLRRCDALILSASLDPSILETKVALIPDLYVSYHFAISMKHMSNSVREICNLISYIF